MALHPHQVAATAARQQANSTNEGATSRVEYALLRAPTAGLRVNKWDAHVLDTEILELLKPAFRSMLRLLDARRVDQLRPELEALLQTMLFVASTGRRRPTPGMTLENVHYAPHELSRRKIVGLFVLSIGMPYVWKRFVRYLSLAQWRDRRAAATRNEIETEPSTSAEDRRTRILSGLHRMETFVLACQLLNLLAFLRNGTYRSLAERCLSLRLRRIAPTTAPRAINFEYMARQLVWNSLMDFGTFVLPFVAWSRQKAAAALARSPIAAPRPTQADQCTLCGLAPAQMPYITSCNHIYCYFCLQTAVATTKTFSCSACKAAFTTSKRFYP